MQLFSADATIFLKKLKKKNAPENVNNPLSKVAHNQHNLFFQYCQPAQNQPKSYFLFDKDVSLRDFNIMTFHETFPFAFSGLRTEL